MRILVIGAGVIGRIYGARLVRAGHEVIFFARGSTLDGLRTGFTVAGPDGPSTVHPTVTERIGDDEFDVALVCVRRDQIDAILPAAAAVRAGIVVVMSNIALQIDQVTAAIGSERVVFAFPGVGGFRDENDVVRYLEVAAQKTTVGRSTGREATVLELFRGAGFAVAVVDDMTGWLCTHAVFIVGIEGAILRHGGDSTRLAESTGGMRELINGVRQGFRALDRAGVSVTPAALRVIFTAVPRPFAVRYWRRQLRGPVGTLSLGPHGRSTADTEFPALCADVRVLLAGQQIPALDELMNPS